MLTLPTDIIPVVASFAHLFSRRVFNLVHVLLVGAILAPGKRTVTAALRAVGFEQEPQFQKYHRVLNRDRWSPLAVARVLLGLLIRAFASSGPLVFFGDETIERRWGRKIKARGIYRDAARSSKEYVVKTSGLRWLSMMLLAPVPWARRIWALPFLTVLAPSERYHQKRGVRHKTSPQWMAQMILQVRRWLPKRELVFVMDNGFSVLELLHEAIHLPEPCTVITPLRMDAALYRAAPQQVERLSGKTGRARSGRKPIKGKRLPNLSQVMAHPEMLQNPQWMKDASIYCPEGWQSVTEESWYNEGPRTVQMLSGEAVWYHGGKPPVPIRWVIVRPKEGCTDREKFRVTALLCTNLKLCPQQILTWYLMRWQGEVTFEEVRAHLGVETQRQWNNLAIARTTPALLGLYSLVTLFAKAFLERHPLLLWRTAWYQKDEPTFSDILAMVRRHLYRTIYFSTADSGPEIENNPRLLVATLDRLTDMLCYAA